MLGGGYGEMSAKDVLRLVSKLVSLLVMCALIVGTINHFYVSTSGYRGLDGYYKMRPNITRGWNVANLGSSHGEYDFDYTGIKGVRGYNLGLNGQYLYYDFKMLKHFSPKFAPGAALIVPVSYFTLGMTYKDERSLNIDARYNQIFFLTENERSNLLDYIKQRYCPALFSSYLLKYLVIDESIGGAVRTGSLNPGQMKKSAIERAAHHQQLMSDGGDATNLKRLKEIISYAKSRGLKPVVVTTPFTTLYISQFSAESLARFKEEVTSACRSSKVVYLDYSQDPRFADSGGLFLDSDHLNVKGSKVFTGIVIQDLRRRGLIPSSSAGGKS